MKGPGCDFSAWALLLIDVQRDFWTRGHRRAFPRFPDRVRDLLACCRRRGLEVVHVRSRFRADRSDWMPPHRVLGGVPCVAGSGGEEVLSFAAEEPGEAVFEKQKKSLKKEKVFSCCFRTDIP